MSSVAKSMGAALRPETMRENDWKIIDELRDTCQKQEARETFYPFFQSCGVCHGYIFSESTQAVHRQFGCCGCVIAYEMEMREAGIRPSTMQLSLSSQASSTAQLKLLDTLLALDARGHTTPQDLRYLHRTRKMWSTRTPLVKTRQMVTRHRMHKDKPLARMKK